MCGIRMQIPDLLERDTRSCAPILNAAMKTRWASDPIHGSSYEETTEYRGITMKVNASVPARINIIGEHTDHSGAIPNLLANIASNLQHQERGWSRGNQTVISLWEAAGGWSADLDVDSNIPIGAGLSSSAALRRNRDVLSEQY